MNINGFANRDLEGPDHRNYPSYPKEWDNVQMGWLRKTIQIPDNWGGDEIRLYFEAVAGQSVIYVNGNKAGENFDFFLPISLPLITEQRKMGLLISQCSI